MKISRPAKNAICIGSLCSVSYLAVYVARNILSAVTPQMIAQGYTEEYIGSISSLYFICYAFGQLINGSIGDKIKAKYMICTGLLGAGLTNVIFSKVTMLPTLAMIVYGLTGFFLSMIYGPMTKVVSENTEPLYTTRCSLGYTLASFLGSPSAGLLASILAWQTTFTVSSTLLFFMAIIGFLFFSFYERRGLIKYGQYKAKAKGVGNVGVLIKHRIIKFSFIAIITGIVRTSVVFWLPTYISQFLGFSPKASAGIFTAATFIISLTTFVSVFTYERLGHDMDKNILVMFSSSAIFFTLTFFVRSPIPNIIFMILAIMSSNGAATMLYSKYCPSLRDTGMVSSATGFLDFLSYMAAAAANIIFANAVSSIGWSNLILVWLAIIISGITVALPYGKIFKSKKNVEGDVQ